MIHRMSTTVTVRRPVGGGTDTGISGLAPIPITAKSVRKFKLMEEDCVVLSFSLAEPIAFKVGDFFDDELFGRFVLAKEQMPRYNTSTGGYDYDLKFEAEYRLWRNWLFCLVADNGDGDAERMECDWRLTDKLSAHAAQITANLAILEQGAWTVQVDTTTTPKASEAHYIDYSAVSILDALGLIADSFECEWWVDCELGVIHFGKCEAGTSIDFRLTETNNGVTTGGNVESMDIADNRNSYANRIYVFGGTQNIPSDYDRDLIFTATEDNGAFSDTDRPLTLDMFEGAASDVLQFIQPTSPYSSPLIISSYQTQSIGAARIFGTITPRVLLNLDNVAYSVKVNVYISNGGSLKSTIYQSSGTAHYSYTERIELDYDATFNSDVTVKVEITLTPQQGSTLQIRSASIDYDTKIQRHSQTRQVTLTLAGGGSYAVTFTEGSEGDPMTFTFDNGTPSGFGSGSKYSLSGLAYDIPLNYYTEKYEAGLLSTIGAHRLHLPLASYPKRYINLTGTTDNSPAEAVIEQAVAFEQEYPRVELFVASVRERRVRDEVEHEDGSKTYENATLYSFTAKRANNTSFDFDTRYLLDGESLRGGFYAPAGASTGNLLAGMSFDLGFDNRSGEYTIIRNTDYGTRLPNGTLKPQVGDGLTLTGWNPRALTALNLVSAAETSLAAKATEYAQAMEEGQFTFTCKMMSDWPFRFVDSVPLHESANKPFEVVDSDDDTQQRWLYVMNGYDAWRLPTEGQKVTIHHAALKIGSKTSRIIGYEFRLDMPWDTPTYIVGETQAYSRLAKIEKEITKLS